VLITFKTSAYANVTMFGEVAHKLLKLMGRRDTVPSAMSPADIPAALEKLQKALDADPAAGSEPAGKDEDSDRERPVSLHSRALPLIELLEAARNANATVMWESGSGA